MGATFVARTADGREPRIAIAARSREGLVSAIGSRTLTPKRELATMIPEASAPAIPKTRP